MYFNRYDFRDTFLVIGALLDYTTRFILGYTIVLNIKQRQCDSIALNVHGGML